jgi:hypothetical protein
MDSTVTSPFPPPQQPTEPMEPVAAHVAPAPASSLAALAGDSCANCAAPLASDQRYCLECGERNGEPRVPAMSGRPVLTPIVPAVTSVTTERPARGGGGASTALIAGVGTLLLALGVGVLIGHSAGSNQQAKSAPPQIITVGGGAAAGTPTPSTATPGDTAAGSGAGATKTDKNKKSGSGDAKAKASTPSSSAVVKKTPGKVTKLGSKGSGKGYKDGKFTGDFFGN